MSFELSLIALDLDTNAFREQLRVRECTKVRDLEISNPPPLNGGHNVNAYKYLMPHSRRVRKMAR